MKAKILIVGGGAMGTSIALHAAQRCDPLREPVILIERDRLGAGSSGRSAAIVHHSYSDRALVGMARDALKVYATFESTTGRSVGYRRTGVLVVCGPTSKQRLESLTKDIEMQMSVGVEVRPLDVEGIQNIMPSIAVDEGSIGAFEPGGGFIDPVRTIQALATMARAKGAITRIGVKDPTLLVEDGKLVGVATSAGNFYAPQVVLATGPWTPVMLRNFGVELPLRIVRTPEVFFEMPRPTRDEDEDEDGAETRLLETDIRFAPDPLDSVPVAHPVLFDLEQGFHARCEPGRGRTRVGRLGFEEAQDVPDPEKFSDVEDEPFTRWAHAVITRRVPEYEHMPAVGAHMAWTTLTPDLRPIVGPVEELPGLYVVTGFSGNDFQLAPSIGEGLAQMLLGEPVSAFDPEFFSPTRFQGAV